MAHDIDDEFYFKPEAGRLLASPADETPSPPCDAQADELDVALAIERLERATTIRVRRITHRWAGLRTFAPDRTTVLGYDSAGEGFFWVAGQGGYGIQTSAAMGRAAAALVAGEDLPADLRALGLSQSTLSPGRLSA
jgi:D-arginine dehydrogenase